MDLTPKQAQVLAFLKRFIAERGFPPTRAEIAQEFGFRSANAAEEHLQALARENAVRLTRGISRGVVPA